MGLWDSLFGSIGSAQGAFGQAGQLQQYQGQQQNSLQGQHPYQSQLSQQQGLMGYQQLRHMGTTQAPQIIYEPINPISIKHFITQKLLIIWEP